MNPTAQQNRTTGARRAAAAAAVAFGLLLSCLPAQSGKDGSGGAAGAERTSPPKAETQKAETQKAETQKADTDKASTGKTATGNAKTGKADTPDAATPDAATPDAGTAAAGPPGNTLLGRITADRCRVRCFASNLSPVYEDELAKGAVVQVGEAVGEYRRVVLPRGVTGYVSKHFSSAPDKGIVKTTRKRVSFRYRPTPKNRVQAPVMFLPEGAELRFLGEKGDWWKVRCPAASAFVPIKELSVIADAGAKARAAFAALAGAHDAEWRNATGRFEKIARENAENERRTKRLEELRVAFQGEAGKPLKDQKLGPVLSGVTALIAELPKDDHLLETARFLESAIQRQQVFVDADIVLNTKAPPPPKPKVIVKPTPVDRLNADLHRIGWLAYRPGTAGPSAYRLEKGGRVISFLFCNSLRYDLSMFDGAEIGVRGVNRRGTSVPYLDVERIEVLTAKR